MPWTNSDVQLITKGWQATGYFPLPHGAGTEANETRSQAEV